MKKITKNNGADTDQNQFNDEEDFVAPSGGGFSSGMNSNFDASPNLGGNN